MASAAWISDFVQRLSATKSVTESILVNSHHSQLTVMPRQHSLTHHQQPKRQPRPMQAVTDGVIRLPPPTDPQTPTTIILMSKRIQAMSFASYSRDAQDADRVFP
jgi:hypothetical protein